MDPTQIEKSELSDREREILRLVATGASNKEIAQALFISANTVKVHLRNIFAKIGVSTRTEAAMYAVNAGLVPGSLRETQGSEVGTLGGTAPALQVGRTASGRKIVWWIGLFMAVVALGLVLAGYFLSPLSKNTSPEASLSERPGWESLAPMPTARSGLAVVAIQNQIFAIGGKTVQDATDVVERYDLAANTWSSVTSKPVPVYDIDAAAIGGKVFVPGGLLSSGQVTDVLDIYDPRQNQWSRGASMPEPASGYALAAFEGKLYLFGGWNGKNYLSTVMEYDPDLDAWTYKTPLSAPRAYFRAVQSGGKIHLLGGFDGRRALEMNETYLPSLDDGENNPWGKDVPLPQGRYAMGAASVVDAIYIVGGQGEKNSTPATWGLLTQTSKWQQLESPPQVDWTNLALIPIGPRIYAVGGAIDQIPTDAHMTYQALFIIVLPYLK